MAVGCVLLAAALAATLAREVPERLGTNAAVADATLVAPASSFALCQAGEHLPAGTGAVRLSLAPAGAAPGPRLAVTVAGRGGEPVAHGTRAAGWRGAAATVRIRPAIAAARTVRVCTTVGENAGVALFAAPGGGPRDAPSATVDGRRIGGRLRLEYLAPEPSSRWSQARGIARRMGFGHALEGASIAVLSALLMLGAAATALWQLARGDK